jgi:hypothetical protein
VGFPAYSWLEVFVTHAPKIFSTNRKSQTQAWSNNLCKSAKFASQKQLRDISSFLHLGEAELKFAVCEPNGVLVLSYRSFAHLANETLQSLKYFLSKY